MIEVWRYYYQNSNKIQESMVLEELLGRSHHNTHHLDTLCTGLVILTLNCYQKYLGHKAQADVPPECKSCLSDKLSE